MANVDIEHFFDSHGVEYVTSGKNVKKGHINLCCPFCGDDPSHHLGLNIKTLAWSCWRNATHRSNYPHKLVHKLLGWPWTRIESIFGGSKKDLSDFDQMAKNLWKEDIEEAMSSVENLELPKNFRKIEPYGVTGRFFEYMESRGFTEKEVLQVCERYKLKCCLSGDWKDRIIVPIYIDGKLVSWTGRSIHKEAFLRYRNLEVEQSVIQPKHTVFNFDEAFGVRPGDTLYILEGPFDVIKLDYYLRNTDNRAVGMFNMTPTEEQVSLFSDLNDGFKKFIVLLDNGELFSSTKLLSTLSFLGHIRLGSLPKGVKDPGDLTEEQVQEFYA